MLIKFFSFFHQAIGLFNPDAKVSSPATESEMDSMCQPGIVGLEQVWELYDMWI